MKPVANEACRTAAISLVNAAKSCRLQASGWPGCDLN